MQGKVGRGFYLVLYLSQHETSSGMILGRCFNTILLDSFRGRSKNISYLFASDRRVDRRCMTRSFSVIAPGARCWRVHSAFHRILALRHDQGKTVYTTANKYGTEPASLWKGVRWSVIRGNKLTLSFSVTALSWSGSGGLILGTVGKNTP